ncbi:hypothetical protein JCM8097_001114 [Rhodosporidiobolus ruineniae]
MSSTNPASADSQPPKDYNNPSPSCLYRPGLLSGAPIQLDPSSLRPHPSAPFGIFTGQLYPDAPADELVEQRGGKKGIVAVKVVEDDRTRVPRDGRREARLLARLNREGGHPNVLALLNAYLTPPSPNSPTSSRSTLFTPYYPHSLRSLISSPTFVPSPDSTAFETFTLSLAYQLFSALSFLHSHGIAHRDVSPNNVVLSQDGRAVLIDFGVAVAVEPEEAEQGEEDREKEGEMHFEVGTGPYRAPELVFGSHSYFPSAIDLWALGCTLAELFTPFSTPSPPSPPSSDGGWGRFRDEPAEEEGPRRKTLFEGGHSDFALAGSIFRVLGTPTVESWPEAAHLPSFSRFTFASFPPTPLQDHLPHLLPSSALLPVLEGLLRYSAAERTSAESALEKLEAGVREQGGEVALPPGVRDRGT